MKARAVRNRSYQPRIVMCSYSFHRVYSLMPWTEKEASIAAALPAQYSVSSRW